MIDLIGNPFVFLIAFGGLLLSLAFHEFAHAWTADRLGDPTPRMQGRVTLNPLAHLDPLGTFALLLTRFGWGKPVMFDPYNLRNPLRDTALIAAAGPASNLLIASVAALVLNLNIIQLNWVIFALTQLVITNIVLAVFNLIPVYPLDGSKVLMAVLPHETAIEYESFMEKYGVFVLIALIFPWAGNVAPVSLIVGPVAQFIAGILL